MISEALLIEEEQDRSSTTQARPPLHWWPSLGAYPGLIDTLDPLTANVGLHTVGIAEVTSPSIQVFPDLAPVPELKLWVDLDVFFPPKKTRTVLGKVMKRRRATFSTAFIDELAEY